MFSVYEALAAIARVDHALVEPATFAHYDRFALRDRAGAARAAALSQGIKAVVRWLRAVHERHQTRRATLELARLDDRMLADIGIGRGDIPYVLVHGRVAGDAANDDRPLALAACG
ncbi:MAG: DUF1127 domain-containing protein [Alphaproteobacteria bacterium]|nr:DUF1127 domain-containing protein [Alphaproteobacteria bacterium]